MRVRRTRGERFGQGPRNLSRPAEMPIATRTEPAVARSAPESVVLSLNRLRAWWHDEGGETLDMNDGTILARWPNREPAVRGTPSEVEAWLRARLDPLAATPGPMLPPDGSARLQNTAPASQPAIPTKSLYSTCYMAARIVAGAAAEHGAPVHLVAALVLLVLGADCGEIAVSGRALGELEELGLIEREDDRVWVHGLNEYRRAMRLTTLQ